MKFQFDIADRERTVEIQRLTSGHRVLIDGREYMVDSVKVREATWSILLREAASGNLRSVEAVVLP
jgi:hypothetical protein